LTRTFSERDRRRARFVLLSVPFFVLPFVILLSCLAVPSQAQEPSQPAQAGIQATTEIVKIDVSVLDRHGDFVSGLAQKQFRVLDDNVGQQIAFFTPVEAPAQVLVLLETSPAVYLIRTEHLTAAYTLLDGLAPDDEIALVTYAHAPQAILAFTPDKSAFAAALGHIQYMLGMGDLNFFDSISTVVDWLAPLSGKKAVVLLTTGLDSSPPARWDALVEKLRGSDVVLYPVALGGSLRQASPKKKKAPRSVTNSVTKSAPKSEESAEPENPLSFAKADGALLALAKITGGHAYFPESPNDFVPIYRQIAAALRHQYVLGIVPQHDGKFHSLTVQILDGRNQSDAAARKHAEYQVFAREGYLAPAH
jgi:Ca-activated chloride channel homolog